MELKKMIEGITKKSPADQQLYNKEDAGQILQNNCLQKKLGNIGMYKEIGDRWYSIFLQTYFGGRWDVQIGESFSF